MALAPLYPNRGQFLSLFFLSFKKRKKRKQTKKFLCVCLYTIYCLLLHEYENQMLDLVYVYLLFHPFLPLLDMKMEPKGKYFYWIFCWIRQKYIWKLDSCDAQWANFHSQQYFQDSYMNSIINLYWLSDIIMPTSLKCFNSCGVLLYWPGFLTVKGPGQQHSTLQVTWNSPLLSHVG